MAKGWTIRWNYMGKWEKGADGPTGAYWGVSVGYTAVSRRST